MSHPPHFEGIGRMRPARTRTNRLTALRLMREWAGSRVVDCRNMLICYKKKWARYSCIVAGFLAGVLFSGAALYASSGPSESGGEVDFKDQVQPIFLKRCYGCHGPDEQKSDFRLDQRERLFQGGQSRMPAVVASRSQDSELMRRISTADPDERMPPKGDRLTAVEIETIKKWIDQGADWNAPEVREHWAFQKPIRRVPTQPVATNWCRNEIDQFVAARLEREGIGASPEAERITLIRRLSFDLLGLPPSPEEVRAFQHDVGADAYERLVDRLLDSPHFGERWGRHWLDLARYADSDGYEKDRPRPYAYLYRDWVIETINDDLPFDRFTIEQLAGDLLPDATLEHRIATGFHRNTLKNTEGGVDQEEDRSKIAKDRVDTTGSVWLGLTVGCAQCHTHKYDPITQKEYYGLYAFFDSVTDTDIPAPRPAELARHRRALSDHKRDVDRVEAEINGYARSEVVARQTAWEQSYDKDRPSWILLKPETLRSENGASLELQSDGAILVSGTSPDRDAYHLMVTPTAAAITGFRLEVLDDDSLPTGPGRTSHGNFVLSEFKVQPSSPQQSSRVEPFAFSSAVATHSQNNYSVGAAIDGDAKTGWAVGSKYNQNHTAVFELATPLTLSGDESLAVRLEQCHGSQHTIGRFRISVTAANPPLMIDSVPLEVVDALRVLPDERSSEQKDRIADFYRSIDPGYRQLQEKLAELQEKKPAEPPTRAQTMTENPKPPVTHIHVRGDFLRPGDEVVPHTFQVLHALRSVRERPNRLDLARWIVDEENSLTARVAVNRIWQHLFGKGLVRTPNDFGVRGVAPTHPELLDWLASEFIQLGWSRKQMIKRIVMSATYRQSSTYRPDLDRLDPNNVLLARQNRFRLEAEVVRDSFLKISGLLSGEIGGPSVKPPLPKDIAALGYANSVRWEESKGADKYRRGLYIFFQRTVPYPMLMTFDAPDSNVTCTRRERSNTPLQSLTLLNDPVFFECAQALGSRLIREHPGDTVAQLTRGFEICVSRTPTSLELERLVELYEGQRLALEDSEDRVRELVADRASEFDHGQLKALASMVAVSRTLLNLDECVMRE